MPNKNYLVALAAICTVTYCTKPNDNPNTNPTTNLSISPSHGPLLTIDTIRGGNFGLSANSNIVYFNGVQANIISSSSSELIVQVPKLAGTGPVTVVTNGITFAGPVFSYDTTWLITTIAGNGIEGSTDGPAASSSFNRPRGIVVDTAGNVFVADTYNHTIRKITPSGIVSTFAGIAGETGYIDGLGNNARFNFPDDLALDREGNIYVVGMYSVVRKITPAGLVTTYAGDASRYGTLDGPADIASFKQLAGVCVDKDANVFVTDVTAENIRKITPDRMVTTFAGTGTTGRDNGPKNAATFFNPSDVVVTNSGIVYTCEWYNPVIRKIGLDDIVTTLVGSTNGYAEGIGSAAKFHGNERLVTDETGNIYVTDRGNYMIRKITRAGETKRLIPSPSADTGGQSPFTFGQPVGLAIDKKGYLYFTDIAGNKIKKLSFQ